MKPTKKRNTKANLLQAAERLFAENGLGGVSVRDITRAAGARNESALHYHFGDMSALIREVFAHRYREIEKARMARLAELDAANRGHDIEALLEAAIAPLFETCLDKEGRLYARFGVQLVTDPRFDALELVTETQMSSATTIRDRALETLAHLPEETVRTRLRRLFTLSIILMADYARLIEAGTAPPLQEAIEEARASLAGFLQAPLH